LSPPSKSLKSLMTWSRTKPLPVEEVQIFCMMKIVIL
jgi:hypothetical protein